METDDPKVSTERKKKQWLHQLSILGIITTFPLIIKIATCVIAAPEEAYNL
jgi:hypothetical protein